MTSSLQLLVTRPAGQAQFQRDALRERGWCAQALPLIAIQPVADPSRVHAAWRHLRSRTWAFFVSPNAVEQFFRARPLDVSSAWPADVRVGAVGPGTVQALRQAGVPVAQITAPAQDAEQVDSEALWVQLAAHHWTGQSVWVVRGDGGRAWLADQLTAQGAHVEFVQAYMRTVPVWDEAEQVLLAQALRSPQQHLWLFSSSQAIDHLTAWAQAQAGAHPAIGLNAASIWSSAQALTTHPRIADRAQAAGFGRVLLTTPHLDALVACIQSALW